MSMLTPPGLKGKQYRVTGNAYPRLTRPHRRRRWFLAAVGGVVVLAVLGWGTLQLIAVFGSPKRTAARACRTAARPTAAPSPAPVPKPGAITVNVYNATTKTGLAKKTADDLKKRGFRIGTIGNAPKSLDKKVKEAAALVAGPAAQRALTVLASQVADNRRISDDRRDGSVDFVIGDAFTSLLTPAEANKALAAATAPVPARTVRHC